MGWLKRRLPKKRWVRVVVCGVSTVLIAGALDMGWVQYERRVVVSVETTRVVGPLNADGMPDYLAVLNAKYGAGVTVENNAAPLLLELAGTEDLPVEWRERVLPALGLPVAEMPARIKDFSQWLETHPVVGSTLPAASDWRDEPEYAMGHKPWKRSEHPVWTAWLASQDRVLARVHEATSRERYFVPLVSPQGGTSALMWRKLVDANIRFQRVCRGANRLLAARGLAGAGEGDMEEFQRDILAEMKLARLFGQGPSIFDFLVSIATENWACDQVSVVAAQAGGIDGPTARRILAAMDALPPMPRPDRTYDVMSRYMGLNYFLFGATHGAARLDQYWEWGQQIDASYRRQDGSREPPEPMPTWQRNARGLFIPLNFNQALRDVNMLEDRLVAAVQLGTYRGRYAAANSIADLLHGFETVPSLLSTRRPAYAYVSGAVSSAVNILTLEERTRVARDLARVALALAAYHAENGAYPEKLEALKEAGILREVPVDGFSDAPLIYRREGEGYVVYSVGDDGKDDGGLPPEKQKRRLEDIVVRAAG